jgi:hypothetical protein
MNKGPNQPQNPGGHRGRRRSRRGKGQQNQPGNSGGQQNMRHSHGGGGGGQGGGRNRRRGGGQPFVGPMDHSYRNAPGNGNDLYAQNGRGRGPRGPQGQPGNGAPEATEPVAATNGKTPIVCFIDDLFFHAKIQETARKLGVKVEFAKAEKETIDRLISEENDDKPSLIIFDLNNANAKPLTLIPKLKSKLKKQTSIVGFLSHIQGDLKLKAQEAGCDMVVPRSAFSQNLPNLLRRHASDLQDSAEY